MRQQRGGVGGGRRGEPGLLMRAVGKVFRFVRLSEFEILFVLFFLIAFLLFKDLNDMQVRGKVLLLLDSWQDAFGGPGGSVLPK